MSENTEIVNDVVESAEVEVDSRDGVDELGDAGKKALEAERTARRETEKQVKALQSQLDELQDAGKSDVEKLQRKAERAAQEAEQLRAEIASRDRALLLREVADEVGLPARLVSRVQGADREAMLADARELMELVVPEGAPRRPAPVREAGSAFDGIHGGAAAGGNSHQSNLDVFSEVMDRAFNS